MDIAPMRNAMLACGAKHLQLVNPAFSDDLAFIHYGNTTTELLLQLQDPARDSSLYTIVTVILNNYGHRLGYHHF